MKLFKEIFMTIKTNGRTDIYDKVCNSHLPSIDSSFIVNQKIRVKITFEFLK